VNEMLVLNLFLVQQRIGLEVAVVVVELFESVQQFPSAFVLVVVLSSLVHRKRPILGTVLVLKYCVCRPNFVLQKFFLFAE